ncbi:MAG: type IX secretion system sortase PorU [Flavobacteriales bacterium]
MIIPLFERPIKVSAPLVFLFLTLPCFAYGQIEKELEQRDERDPSSATKGEKKKSGDKAKAGWQVERVKRKKDEPPVSYLNCDGCAINSQGLPVRTFTKKLGAVGTHVRQIEVSLEQLRFKTLSKEEKEALGGLVDSLSPQIEPIKRISYSKKIPYLKFSFVPLIRKPSGTVKKLVHHEVRVRDLQRGRSGSQRGLSFAPNSVLRNGELYRIGVTESGVYSMGRSFLKGLGIDPDSLDPGDLNVYGNAFGMLPFQNHKKRPDDLKKNAISVLGGGDGSFDVGDKLLFYAKGPDVWKQNQLTKLFTHRNHLYTDTAWYFLKIGPGSSERIQEEAEVTASVDEVVESVNVRAARERELVNLVHSGRQWAGESIPSGNPMRYRFQMGKLVPGSKLHVELRFLARTLGTSNSSSFDITINGGSSDQVSIGGVNDHYLAPRGNFSSTEIEHTVGSNRDKVSVEVGFQGFNPSSKGWLDWIVVNAVRQLRFDGAQLEFRDTSSVGPGKVVQFRFQASEQVDRIWDISDPTNAKRIPFDKVGGSPRFRVYADSLRHFVAFDKEQLSTPIKGGKVPNQNLHGASQPDMVILSGNEFLPAARELASFHRQEGMDILVTTPRKVYNEFGGGMRDITAIKDLMRMFYVRAGTDTSLMPDHLLLMGDGSLNNRLAEMDEKWIPTFQSQNSLSPTSSYTSDDYFGLLDSSESSSSADLVDIGIGRLPVRSFDQAQDMVRKIKEYSRGNSSVGGNGHCEDSEFSLQDPNWRDLVVFVADDQDGNLHMQQAEEIANKVRNFYPVMNQQKFYLDAFQQTRASGGERYPEVNRRIDQRMRRGALIMNYVGHGGERGWAKERILTQKMIKEWKNRSNLPLFVTATCEFTRFDDHRLVSAGENALLNPEGGAIGLLSTTRVVYASENKRLNLELYNHALQEENGKPLRLGEVVRRTKKNRAQSEPSSINHRKFMYFGDPAVRLNIPRQNLQVDSINASPIASPMDTIHALSKVTVSGRILEQNGTLDSDFEGIVHPLVMDKRQNIETQANDGGNPMNFEVFNSWLHRGKASVKNGKFEFAFVVPKDITYQYGNGRISLVADGSDQDAHGYTESFIIGGTDSNAAKDERGPDISIYMNDKNFVPGGTTDKNPLLMAELKDRSGINISSSSIGHDIKAVLDEKRADAIVLNDHYRSGLDTYKKGDVKYRLNDLEEGEHKIKVKAWDVHNNPSQRTVDFVVSKSAELALDHVLNYPNPFTTHTEFFFEHNQACNFLNVRIRIFTVSGKVVETIERRVHSDGFRSEGIAWDGTDRFGDPLGKGVYVYKLKVTTPDGKKANKFEKLVLLK